MDSASKPKKKVVKSYWNGKEHIKAIGPDSPFVMLTKLPLTLTGNAVYKGHDCLNKICPKKGKAATQSQSRPLPPTQPSKASDNLSATIDAVAKTGASRSPGRPKIGQAIRFHIWQTSLGANIPIKSAALKAKVVDYDPSFDLYEVELFTADHPCIPDFCKQKSKRIAVNSMLVSWDTLADPTIL
ncbi:uncharacterized protein LOC107359740 [Tetranychus urticae]|uniref:Uncharacterized protein n=1 Tax=Tetranychus urticae TaxID=32264 RepID=T1K2I6_TETUR|nr:uncharacterized protein LOC107359740 [Tetranychus urticae]